MNKIRAGLVFGLGYVLGARAGRARYEQMKRQAMRVMEHPRTRRLSDQARETVTRTVQTRVPDTVTARLPEPVVRRVREQGKGTRPANPATSPGTASVAGFESPASMIGESGEVRIDLSDQQDSTRTTGRPGSV